MTEIPVERDNQGIQNKFVFFATVCLMIIGFAVCVNLLRWAIDHKFKNIPTVEQSDITLQVREKQLACLAKNIYHEAGSEPFEGKVAIAQVTINRANSGQFSGDICKVVYQKNIFYEKVLCQFSWVCDRVSASKPKHGSIYDESMEVAKKVLLEGFRLPSLHDALYFHADYINPGWKKTKVAHIGRHIFYK